MQYETEGGRVQEILQRFEAIVQDPTEHLRQWKTQHGKQIIACVPMHFPEEIIHAAGLLPVMTWTSPEPFTVAQAHVPSFFCGVVRGIVDMALRGRLACLDGIVFPDTCLQVRGIKNILHWNYPCAFQHLLYLPPVLGRPTSSVFLRDQLRRFKTDFETFIGHEITDQALRQSLTAYNRNRGLLRDLYALRRDRPGLLKAREVLAIVFSSMLMPKEAHSDLLAELLVQLKRTTPANGSGVRLVLAGSLCEAPQVALLDLLEEAGAVVVDDDLYTGSRYFVQDTEANGSPMEALARRYEQMMARCPSRIDHEHHWGPYLIDLVRQSHAQGVVNWMVKYCEPHNLWYPDVKRSLEAAGIPEFLLETEHEITSLEQIKTRFQVFVEMLLQADGSQLPV